MLLQHNLWGDICAAMGATSAGQTCASAPLPPPPLCSSLLCPFNPRKEPHSENPCGFSSSPLRPISGPKRSPYNLFSQRPLFSPAAVLCFWNFPAAAPQLCRPTEPTHKTTLLAGKRKGCPLGSGAAEATGILPKRRSRRQFFAKERTNLQRKGGQGGGGTAMGHRPMAGKSPPPGQQRKNPGLSPNVTKIGTKRRGQGSISNLERGCGYFLLQT